MKVEATGTWEGLFNQMFQRMILIARGWVILVDLWSKKAKDSGYGWLIPFSESLSRRRQ